MVDIKSALKQWHGTGGLNVFECICTLAEAYAVEHPADDDEPITPEWLESVGLRSSDAFHDRHAIGEYFFLVRADSHQWRLAFNVGLHDSDLVGDYHTRGDVRRLCAALGMKLKEQT